MIRMRQSEPRTVPTIMAISLSDTAGSSACAQYRCVCVCMGRREREIAQRFPAEVCDCGYSYFCSSSSHCGVPGSSGLAQLEASARSTGKPCNYGASMAVQSNLHKLVGQSSHQLCTLLHPPRPPVSSRLYSCSLPLHHKQLMCRWHLHCSQRAALRNRKLAVECERTNMLNHFYVILKRTLSPFD